MKALSGFWIYACPFFRCTTCGTPELASDRPTFLTANRDLQGLHPDTCWLDLLKPNYASTRGIGLVKPEVLSVWVVSGVRTVWSLNCSCQLARLSLYLSKYLKIWFLFFYSNNMKNLLTLNQLDSFDHFLHYFYHLLSFDHFLRHWLVYFTETRLYLCYEIFLHSVPWSQSLSMKFWPFMVKCKLIYSSVFAVARFQKL